MRYRVSGKRREAEKEIVVLFLVVSNLQSRLVPNVREEARLRTVCFSIIYPR